MQLSDLTTLSSIFDQPTLEMPLALEAGGLLGSKKEERDPLASELRLSGAGAGIWRVRLDGKRLLSVGDPKRQTLEATVI